MAERDQDDGDPDTDGLENEQGSFEEDGVRRPMNAFFIFCKRHRDVVREKYPHLENRSITKILGEWWANLDSSEKSSYTALAKQYKEAFMKAHPDFKWYKLPTAPTRTLVTRPTNNRCLQTKKEKLSPKSCESDKQFDGLTSFISQDELAESVDGIQPSDIDRSSAIPPNSPPDSILKPPKKRYLVNGEFKCQSTSLKYDNRDYQTQNACSALLELAEICVNTSGQSSSSSPTVPSTSTEGSLYGSLFNYPKSSEYMSFASLKTRCDSQKHKISPSLASYNRPSAAMCSNEYFPHHSSLSDIQDQPLNLCKEKEKTFTASNQQLINHLVDKFLCDTPSSQVQPPASSKPPTTLPSFPQFVENKPQIIHGFTLSAAIESAIDQAYSQSSPKCAKVPSEIKKTSEEEDTEKNTEVVFIDKIKKACLASSHKLLDKPKTSRYIIPSLTEEEQENTKKAVAAVKEEEPQQACNKHEESPTTSDSAKSSDKESTYGCTSKQSEVKFSSSKYYSKCGSPPKKSRVWCNLFMKEQLKQTDSDGNAKDKEALLFDLSFPVRRNSQRTCKGRRYQALITEGLLQSTKERKASIGRKSLPSCETKSKTKSSPSPPSPLPLPKSKRKKREKLGKSSSAEKEEEDNEEEEQELDAEKSEFDLNEKIASLPKCSFETLNKKRKMSSKSSSSSVDSKSNSSGSVKTAKKSIRDVSSNVQAEDTSSKSSEEISTGSSSSGRFKTGEFDLEQHIASLPKCDIEVLNKRRNKKE